MSFAPYQVDYSVKNTSKTFGFSKKRVSFKFGIANNEALAQGLTGAHCRGSEHEIIFIWSLNTGKRQVLADGKDVHYSESGLNGWTTDQVFQHHFQLRVPNFSTPLRCHLITQPANRDVPSVHPFDLRLNGISYFAFSKIFQLGTPQMITRPLKGGGGGGGRSRNVDPDDDPYCTPEERKAIAAAKLASIRDLREWEANAAPSIQSAPAVMNRDEGNLINLLDDPAPPAQFASSFVSNITLDTALNSGQFPPPPPPAYGQQPYSNYALGPPPPQQQLNPYGQPPPQQQPNPYGQPSYEQQNAFAQPPPQQSYEQQNAFAQPPSQQSDPFGGYGQPPQQQPWEQHTAYAQPPPQQSDPYGGYAQPTPPSQPSQPNQFAYQQTPPAQGYGQPPAQQQQQQPQYPGFASPPPNSMMSPAATVASYGSAPSFAQPPRPQYQQPPPQQQYPGYPQY